MVLLSPRLEISHAVVPAKMLKPSSGQEIAGGDAIVQRRLQRRNGGRVLQLSGVTGLHWFHRLYWFDGFRWRSRGRISGDASHVLGRLGLDLGGEMLA